MASEGMTWRKKAQRARWLAPVFVGSVLIAAFLWLPVSAETGWVVFALISSGAGLVAAVLAFSFRARFFCPGCNKHVPTGMEWVCGYCDSPNGGTFNTFLHSCGTCGRAPSLLICPHPHLSPSGNIEVYPIALAESNDPLPHPARRLTPQQPGESIEQAKARWIRERRLVEAELLNAGAQTKSTLARAKRLDTAAERELERAFQVTPPQSARSRSEQEGERIRDEILADLERVTVSFAELHRAHKAAVESLALRNDLTPAAKATLKHQLAIWLDIKERQLTEEG